MKYIFLIVSLGIGVAYFASSVLVISNSSEAQKCARSAKLAARDIAVTKKDITLCSQALLDSSLVRKDKAATLVNRAIIFMQFGDYQTAYKDLITAQKITPHLGAVYVNLGNIFYQGESYHKALENYNMAIDKGLPEVHVAYMNRGITYQSMNNPLAAIKDFRKAAELAPEWELPNQKMHEILRLDNNDEG